MCDFHTRGAPYTFEELTGPSSRPSSFKFSCPKPQSLKSPNQVMKLKKLASVFKSWLPQHKIILCKEPSSCDFSMGKPNPDAHGIYRGVIQVSSTPLLHTTYPFPSFFFAFLINFNPFFNHVFVHLSLKLHSHGLLFAR